MPAPDYATEIAALEQALATGQLEIQAGGFGGDRVVFRSISDLLASLNYFKAQAAANNPNTKPASTLAAYDGNI